MTVTAPPRPPRPSDPVDREELEALVEALIEEARQRARRRRRIYTAVAAGVALVAVAVATAVERATDSQTASPALAARSGAAAGGTPSSKIAFVRAVGRFMRPASWELYVMNPDGSGKRRLARHVWVSNFGESPLAWSPDRRKLVFAAHVSRSAAPCAGYCGKEIFVINADGSGLRRLTRNAVRRLGAGLVSGRAEDRLVEPQPRHGGGRLRDERRRQRSAEPDAEAGQPRWARAGRRTGGRSCSRQCPLGSPPRASGWPYRDVYVMNADGSGQRNLTPTPEAGAGDPAWSPDGQHIAFTRLAGPPGEVRIVVMNADGSAKHAVTPTLAHPGDRGPAAVWSPDGRRIAFWDDFAIYVVNADGSGLRRLARNAFEGPSWSPDGRKLIFVRLLHPKCRPARDTPPPPSCQAGDLWVMNADGSGQRNLTRTQRGDGHAATWAR